MLTGPLLDAPAESMSSVSRRSTVMAQRALMVLLYLALLLLAVPVALLIVLFVWPYRSFRRWCEERYDSYMGMPPKSCDSWAHPGERPPKLDMRSDVTHHSVYLSAEDGTKLAVDVWLPVRALAAGGGGGGGGRSVPCILHQSRYFRSTRLQWPLSWLFNGGKPVNFINGRFFKAFLSRGMAVVSFDVRGSGASFGRHLGPWHAKERTDALTVLQHVLQQPWCNGRIGLWGISYEGTAAFVSSLDLHPNVIACCPMYMFWDVYGDVSFPGGVPMRYFLENWQRFLDAIDNGVKRSWLEALFLDGCSPVPGGVSENDFDGTKARAAAIKDHAENWSCHSDAHLRFLDDVGTVSGTHVRDACAFDSVRRLLKERPRDELRWRLPHMLHVSGWLDATAAASLLAYAYLPCRSRHLLVGPWNHGGTQHVRTHHRSSASRFDFFTEVGDFFLAHLGGTSSTAHADAKRPLQLESTSTSAKKSSQEAVTNGSARSAEAHLQAEEPNELRAAGAAAFAEGSAAPVVSAVASAAAAVIAAETAAETATHVRMRASSDASLQSHRSHWSEAGGSVHGMRTVRYYSFQDEQWRAGVVPDPQLLLADPTDFLAPKPGKPDFPWHPTQRRDLTYLLCAGGAAAVAVNGSGGGGDAEMANRKSSGRIRSAGEDGSLEFGMVEAVQGKEAPAGAVHDLKVDIWSDEDARGTSRWSAMSNLFDHVSYDMDGPRVNHMLFTSPPLPEDMEVTGFPVVTLHLSADRTNLDVFVYLQAVDRRGRSIYVTEGCFRAQHRRLEAPTGVGNPTSTSDRVASAVAARYDVRAFPGTPLHSYRKADAMDLEAGEPAELSFALMPTSFTFLAGQRVRLSVSGADARHFRALEGDSDHHVNYTLRVYSGGNLASKLVLPVPLPSIPYT